MSQDWQAFVDQEVGMTLGNAMIEVTPEGLFKLTMKIETIFGSEVDGQISGVGRTMDEAKANLAEERRRLNESLWA